MPSTRKIQRQPRQFDERTSRPARAATRQPSPSWVGTTDPDVPIWGAAKIGELIGLSERQTYHLLESRALKGAKKIRGKWSARPSVLRAQWESGDAGDDA